MTTTGGGSGTSYSRTVTSTDNSGSTDHWNDDTDLSTHVATDTGNSTVQETGSNATSTDYTLTEVDGSTTTDTETANSASGISTLTHSAAGTSSLHETGDEGTGALYTMDKTGNTSANTTRTADAEMGDYTLSGTTGTSSTAIESNTHGTDTATFTEILAEDVATLSTEGNDQAGQYEMSESGTRSDNFVDDGTDSSGTFHVTEGSSGSFESTTTGDDNNGATSVVETSNTGYSVTQTVSGSNPFTMTENGTETATATETGDSVTGDYTRTENGTDVYTLGESGTLSGAFSDNVTGTDGYASTETGNHAMQTYGRTTTGGGTWTRTASGGTLTSGSGTNGYTLTESGDQSAGHFSQSETGTDRYGLVEKFDDVSNANGASTPGNVTFHANGLPFRDPGTGPATGCIKYLDDNTAVPKKEELAEKTVKVVVIVLAGAKDNSAEDLKVANEIWKQANITFVKQGESQKLDGDKTEALLGKSALKRAEQVKDDKGNVVAGKYKVAGFSTSQVVNINEKESNALKNIREKYTDKNVLYIIYADGIVTASEKFNFYYYASGNTPGNKNIILIGTTGYSSYSGPNDFEKRETFNPVVEKDYPEALAHELGHAFGLPHDDTSADKDKSLMRGGVPDLIFAGKKPGTRLTSDEIKKARETLPQP